MHGNRLKFLREKHGLSNTALARKLRLKNAKAVEEIESGDQEFTPELVARCAEVLEGSYDFLTSPFVIAGEAKFSWLQDRCAPEKLREFELLTGEWVGAYRYLGEGLGFEFPPLMPSLRLTEETSDTMALATGEAVSDWLELGNVPSQNLLSAIESKLKVLVLMVDADKRIYGASCRLPKLDTILIRRTAHPARRNIALAHELFHLLTWESMPPAHYDSNAPARGNGVSNNRVEELANLFAIGLLLPEKLFFQHRKLVDPRNVEFDQNVHHLAEHFGVLPKEILLRLWQLKMISSSQRNRFIKSKKFSEPKGESEDFQPYLFGKKYLEVIKAAMEKGFVSQMRVCHLYDMESDDLGNVFEQHGLENPLYI